MQELLSIRNRISIKNIMILIIFVICSLIYISPIFKNFNYWGQMDWDQFTFWNAVPRKTILTYHQFPLWNPYSNGGNIILAHPHSSFLSPFYVFVLVFGPLVGLKLEMIVHLVIGLWGMFFLSQYLKLSKFSSYLPSFIYMLSSIYALHITEGHAEWMNMAFVPYVFLFLLKSLENKRYILGGIISFSLMYLGGSIDALSVSSTIIFVYSLSWSLQKRKITLLKNLTIIFTGTILLCAIKLLPMLEFLFQRPRLIGYSDGASPSLLSTILLNSNQAGLYLQSIWNFPQITKELQILNGWHEYGAYIGIMPLLLFFFGVIIGLKKRWPLILTGLISLLIALGNKSPINLWDMLRLIPPYNCLTCPSRFILGFIFFASLISGLALSEIEKMLVKKKYVFNRLIIFTVLLIVFLDLLMVNSHILKYAFIINPAGPKQNTDFAQRWNHANFYSNYISRSSMFPIFLSNSGIIDSYEVVNVKRGNVLTISDQVYMGEAYLLGTKGTAAITYFSPNRVVVNIKADESGLLVLNQNYYKGWRVKGGKSNSVKPFNGLVAAEVDSAVKRVTFYYLPNSFIMGCIISVVSLLSGVMIGVYNALEKDS